MNKENLLRAADYIKEIPQERFDMNTFRKGGITSHECNTVGCVIGHCTVLDTKENIDKCTLAGTINFISWSENFFGLDICDEEWGWLFSYAWLDTDNTPTGAAKRIRHFVENGLPEDWIEQMEGKKPLCYA